MHTRRRRSSEAFGRNVRPRLALQVAAAEFMVETLEMGKETGPVEVSARFRHLLEQLHTVSYHTMPPNVQASLREQFKALVPGDAAWAEAVDVMLPAAPGTPLTKEMLVRSVHSTVVATAAMGQWDQVVPLIRRVMETTQATDRVKNMTDNDIVHDILTDRPLVERLVEQVPSDVLLEPIIAASQRVLVGANDIRAFANGLLTGIIRSRKYHLLPQLPVPIMASLNESEKVQMIGDTVASVAECELAMRELQLAWDSVDGALLIIAAIERGHLELLQFLVPKFLASLQSHDRTLIFFTAGEVGTVDVVEYMVKLPAGDENALFRGMVAKDRVAMLSLLPNLDDFMERKMRDMMDVEAVDCLSWYLQQSGSTFTTINVQQIQRYAAMHATPAILRMILGTFHASTWPVALGLVSIVTTIRELEIQKATDEWDSDDEDKLSDKTQELLEKVDILREYGHVFEWHELAMIARIPALFKALDKAHVLPFHVPDFMDKLVEGCLPDVFRELAARHLLQIRHLRRLPKELAKEPIFKQLYLEARPSVSAEMGKLGYWIDDLSVKYEDPDLLSAYASIEGRGSFISLFDVETPLLTLTCRLAASLADEKSKEMATIGHFMDWEDIVHWAYYQRNNRALILQYIKLHPELQRVGLGQHSMQVAEQALTRASSALAIDHIVLDYVHAPYFFASDVRYGWFDLTGERQLHGRNDSLYVWFAHKLGAVSGGNKKIRHVTDRIWSTPAARAIHRTRWTKDVMPVAKLAHTISKYLSSDAPATGSDSLNVAMHGVTMHLRRVPFETTLESIIRLKHHLLRMGNRDRVACGVELSEFAVDDTVAPTNIRAILMQLLVDLGRVWWRPLALADRAWLDSGVFEAMQVLTPDPAPRFNDRGIWVPQPRPPSYARPKNPDDEDEDPVRLVVPKIEPPLTTMQVLPGRDPTVDPYAPGQPPPFPGRYDHHEDTMMLELEAQLAAMSISLTMSDV